jgi:hypothetical protein
MSCDNCNTVFNELSGFIHNDNNEKEFHSFIPSPTSKYYQYENEYNNYESVEDNLNFISPLAHENSSKLLKYCDTCVTSMLVKGLLKQNSQIGGIIYPYICICCQNVITNPPKIGYDFNIGGNRTFGNYKSNTLILPDLNSDSNYLFSETDMDENIAENYYLYVFGKMEPNYIPTNYHTEIICYNCCKREYDIGNIIFHDKYIHHLLAGHTFETLDCQIDIHKNYIEDSKLLPGLLIHRKQLELKNILHKEIIEFRSKIINQSHDK